MNKPLKISTKLFLGVSLISIACLAVLFVVINTYVRGIITGYVSAGHYNHNIVMKNELDYWIGGFSTLVEGMGIAVKDMPREQVFNVTRNFYQNFKSIILAFVGFPDGYAIANHGQPPVEGWVSTERDWYIVALEGMGRPVISYPYWSLTAETWVISASQLLPDVGGGEAVVAFLVTLNSLFEIVAGFSDETIGYVFLLTNDGYVIYHPNPEYAPTYELFNIRDSIDYGEMLPTILSGAYLEPFYSPDLGPSYILSSRLPMSGWVVATVIPQAEINAPVNNITTIVLAVVIAGFLLLAVFGFIGVSKLLNSGIKKAIHGFRGASVALGRGEELRFSNNKDNSFGLDKMSAEFEKNLLIMEKILRDISTLSYEFAVEGDFEYRIDESSYDGAYKELIKDVNAIIDTQTQETLPLINTISSIAEGNFDVEVIELPGRKIILTNAVNSIIQKLDELYTQINELAEKAGEGDLTIRIDTSNFSGSWASLTGKLNYLLEAVDEPLTRIEKNIVLLTKGDFSPLEGEFRGRFKNLQGICNIVSNVTYAYILEISEVLSAIAEGDLTPSLKLDYIGSYTPIKTAINKILENLNQILIDVKQTVDNVANGADQISASAVALADGSQKQTASIEELLSSINMIYERSTKASENTKLASESTINTKDSVQAGNEAIKSMAATMNKIKTSSESIGKIIDVITNIAFQTNLLALNASVEAARAGEHGRGFSVVADEVRSLAGRSQESATETASIIGEDLNQVAEGLKATANVVEAFEVISKSIGEISNLISEISDISEEQLESLNLVNVSVEDIAKVVTGTSATAEESASAAEELSATSELLRQKIAYFKLNL